MFSSRSSTHTLRRMLRTTAGLQAKMAKESTELQDWVLYATNRASKAIFATSLTTAGAFAATTTSNIMPIASFGIFAALLVFMLFLINVLLLPSVLVLYEVRRPLAIAWLVCHARIR